MSIHIKQATASDAPIIASFAKALTDEIIVKTGARHFNVNITETTELCRALIEQGNYTVFLAISSDAELPIGFATLCESHALYAEGTFGIIQECYIQPEFRSQQVGSMLLKKVAEHAQSLGWKRLELCTPPLPEFARTVNFYAENGFEATGGRKMKLVLERT
ncbi:GNAT family N-acetyltransferase [Pelobacter seleniigenes]|uniref:GNAT family N-acetyltransferase n=1 Tax=Pelobacter seleniigenes TaxID=407188 RepID=UPI0004A78389|nr:GNAT family N-acetyltransferase [Pelobacter seleniigenes]